MSLIETLCVGFFIVSSGIIAIELAIALCRRYGRK